VTSSLKPKVQTYRHVARQGQTNSLIGILVTPFPYRGRIIKIMRVCCTDYEDDPYQELFMWAVFFNRIPLANVFLTRFPNPVGSALVASKLCRSLAKKANSPAMQCLAAELNASARFVVASADALFVTIFFLCWSNG